MKKIFTFILAVCIVASFASSAAFAEENPNTEAAITYIESENVEQVSGDYDENIIVYEESDEEAEYEADDVAEGYDDIVSENSEVKNTYETEPLSIEDPENSAEEEIDVTEEETDVTEEDTTESFEDDYSQEDISTESKENVTDEGMKKNSVKKASSSTTINVTKKSIDNKYSGNVASAINAALQEAGKNATGSKPYTVKVDAGSYSLKGAIRIGSDTTLDLTGVTLKRAFSGNMLYIENYKGVEQKGYCYKNITIKGGTFDHDNGTNVAVKLAHVKNMTLKDVTIKNSKNAHLLETAGVSGLTISGCTFSNQVIDKNTLYYEAIQLDIPVPEHFNVYAYEALTSKNVIIDNCKFYNVPRGVGSHTAILNAPFSGLTIKNCTFEKCDSAAIQCLNWNNVSIKNNIIKDCTRGIAIYSVLDQGNGTFLPSFIYGVTGVQKSTESEGLSDKYIQTTCTNSNIVIENNNIAIQGDDPYTKYRKTAIFVGGAQLKTSKTYSDNSGKLPSGNYYIDNVSIKNNKITSCGDGIRFENTRGINVSENSINFKLASGDTTAYYGIQLRTESKAVSIDNNVIDKAPSNAIFLSLGSSADKINKNIIKTPGKYGVSLEGSTAEKITENKISSPTSVGIFVFSKSNAKEISYNTVTSGKQSAGHAISVTDKSNAGTITKNLVSAPKGYYGINVSYGSSVTNIKDNAAATDKIEALAISSDSKVSKKSGNYKVKSLFSDVMDAGAYYCMPVYWAASKGVTNGYNDGTFGPAKNCTRAHVVTFLWRMAGQPEPRTQKNPFKDIKKGQYYYKAVLWASEKGITKGYNDGTFRPNATCLREHVVTFLYRYAGKPKVSVKKNPFNDVKVSDYYYAPAVWANSKGIAKGYTSGKYKGGFGPKLDCLREHVVTFLYRYKK